LISSQIFFENNPKFLADCDLLFLDQIPRSLYSEKPRKAKAGQPID
jgi:hypothetical protein